MKKLSLSLVSVFTQLNCFDGPKLPPPSYYAQESAPVENIADEYFLGALAEQKTQRMASRAQPYFSGTAGFQPQPLMGLALLVAAADTAKGLEDAQVCVDLADGLLNHPLIVKTQTSKNKAQEYLCRAVNMKHPAALEKLSQINKKKITLAEAQAKVIEEDPAAQLLLKIIRAELNTQNAELVNKAGLKFLQGSAEKGRSPDPLRALVVFCYAFHKYPGSYSGPQALVELMINQDQEIFTINKKIARHYLKVARLRGLPNEAEQELNQAIEQAIEPQDDSFGSQLLNWMAHIFG